MTNFRTRFIAAVSLFGLYMTFSATAVQAQTASAPLLVTANVLSTCELATSSTVDFGNLTPTVGAADVDVDGAVNWSCTDGTTAEITIEAGGSRILTGPSSIPYELYTDVGRTFVWGSAATTGVTVTGNGMTSLDSTTVFGQIVGSDYEDASLGVHNDSLQVTITF